MMARHNDNALYRVPKRHREGTSKVRGRGQTGKPCLLVTLGELLSVSISFLELRILILLDCGEN